MATLPKRGTSRSARRRNSQQTTGGDITRVAPVSDPGINAPAGAFGGLEGRALESAGANVSNTFTQIGAQLGREDALAKERAAKLEDDTRKANASVKRSVAIKNYEDNLHETMNTFRQNSSLTDLDELAEFGKALDSQIQLTVNEHLDVTGDEDSSAKLFQSLSNLRRSATAGLSKESKIEIDNIQQDQRNKEKDELRVQTRSNPINFRDALEQGEKIVDRNVDDLTPDQERAERMEIRNFVTLDTIDGLIDSGKLADARRMLEDAHIQRNITDQSDIRRLETEITTLQNEPLVEVEGPDGNPILLPRSLAAGKNVIPKETKAEELANSAAIGVALFKQFEGDPEAQEMVRSVFGNRGIQINTAGKSETAFQAAQGGNDADRLRLMQEDSLSSTKVLNSVKQIKAALDSGAFKTGTLGGARQVIARFGNTFGVDLNIEGLTGAEAADALENGINTIAQEFLAQIKKGRSGQPLINLIQSRLPQLFRTEEGNKIVADILEGQSLRVIEMAQMADDFVAENGELSPPGKNSFFSEFQKFEEKNPVFSKELEQRIRGLGTKKPRKIKELLNETRKKVSKMTAEDIPSMSQEEAQVFLDKTGKETIKATFTSEQKQALIDAIEGNTPKQADDFSGSSVSQGAEFSFEGVDDGKKKIQNSEEKEDSIVQKGVTLDEIGNGADDGLSSSGGVGSGRIAEQVATPEGAAKFGAVNYNAAGKQEQATWNKNAQLGISQEKAGKLNKQERINVTRMKSVLNKAKSAIKDDLQFLGLSHDKFLQLMVGVYAAETRFGTSKSKVSKTGVVGELQITRETFRDAIKPRGVFGPKMAKASGFSIEKLRAMKDRELRKLLGSNNDFNYLAGAAVMVGKMINKQQGK
jgi:hypothetical protein